MKLLRQVLTAVGSTALACALTLSFAGSAHAGTRGQQIVILNPTATATSYLVEGYDQDGNKVRHCFQATGYKTWISGWWWRDSMEVGWYYGPTNCNNNDFAYALYTYNTSIPLTSSNDWQAIARSGNTTSTNNVQIEFFDNKHIANSIRILGTDQGGTSENACWATPGWDTMLSNWWWHGSAYVTTYASSDCSGTANSAFTWGLGAYDGQTVGITD